MISNIILIILAIVGAPFLIYGGYFFVIGLLGLRKHNTFAEVKEKKHFAAVIAARNEGAVIGNLIDSLKNQHYPEDKLDIFVLPNNCTDDTEAQALAHGAKIFHCAKSVHSKGGALSQFFDAAIRNNEPYDAYCVFDADNLVKDTFFDKMNNALVAGAEVAQGYRESKNPKNTWISGSQTVFYMIVNRFLNLSRYSVGLSAILNGTAFMVSKETLQDGGWHTKTFTEDIEFTTQQILKGKKVTWVPEAVTYDEHPLDFNTSWKQRKRWSTGVMQCCTLYVPQLWRNFKETHKIIYFDMVLYMLAPFVQIFTFIYFVFGLIVMTLLAVNTQIVSTDLLFSLAFNIVAIVTCAASVWFIVKLEHHSAKHIKGTTFLTFWFYLLSWIFINFDCIFRPLKSWEPIAHTQSVSMAELSLTQ